MPETERSAASIVAQPRFLVACLALLCVAWAFVIAPFGGADEPGHFLRSAALARGQLTGVKEENKPDGILYWRTRVSLDPRFDAANAFPVCFRFQSGAPACGFSFVTPGDEARPSTASIPVDVGLYPPAPYLLPALGTVFGPRLISLYAARLLNAAGCLLLLSWAFAAARRRGGFAALGVVLVATPAVFFFASTVNPSGLELCAALAAWYLLVEFFGDRRPSRAFGAQVAIALGVCALARPLGPLLVATIVGCTFVASPLTLRAGLLRLRRHPLATAATALALLFSVVWYLTKFSPSTHRALAGAVPVSTLDQLQTGLGFVPGLLRDLVGNFGWLDTPAPFAAWFPWLATLAVVVVVGWRHAPATRHRVGAGLALAAAIGVMLSALFQSYTLFHFPALQMRHYLPFLMGAFVLLMDAIPAPSPTLRRWLVWSWAAVQSLCLAHAARRYLYGLATPRHTLAPGLTDWEPMLPVWLAVAVGTLAAAAAAAHLQRAQPVLAQNYGT